MVVIIFEQRASPWTAFKVINLTTVTWGISVEGYILYNTGVIQLLFFMREERKEAQASYCKLFSARILRNHSEVRVRVFCVLSYRRLWCKAECKWLREQRIENRVFCFYFLRSKWTKEMHPFDDRQRAEEYVCIKINCGELWQIPSGALLIVMVVNMDHLFWNHY